jgi:hypothetical protein
MASRTLKIPVYLELGKQRTFALTYDWPGWSRPGKGEAAALAALSAYAARYAAVPAAAHVPFAADAALTFNILERIPGDATTDFGAPGRVPQRDSRPIAATEAGRLAALLRATWTVFDRAARKAPPELRKGPRGGGRDRDAIAQHVLNAEAAYVRKLGLKLAEPTVGDRGAIDSFRHAVGQAVSSARGAPDPDPKRWPVPYFVRRTAWHAMDHAWEIEDRSTSSG